MSERSATSLEGHQEDAAVVEPAHDENHQDVESNLLLATLILMDAPESAYPCCVRHQVRMAAKPPPMPKDHDDTQDLTPSGFVPQGFPEGKVTYRGKNSNVDASWITIGAWPWGDTATWHWDDATERGPLKQAWQILLKKGVNHIDTAQVYGSGESKRICGELVAGMNQNDFVMRTKW
ncbi:hypothetical protein LTR91_011438 [Friedmanniomyces endolithicus]|uniref:NADP-dependent oxidoreductase domain-containing protein n=1 Tax=Friedmanniomyces endolithicus TaxID=329885 RepID=A0AAN6KH88_9PEZI|nr:hypothetical protein LTS09_009975 [Friedmanniomyces endolithicus]KAK0303726.1 hypothetical protein LTR01_007812 [Friedmanniomyces endolithicus]KAK0313967.1 hypothetical protein LTR82_013277 [Friedmanniomyces endolithicus]KAK0829512.1 hypothetical protein LTR73_004456 [Friedmanniomyces endolithicus]KAK0920305.1 hypothetical protein LTR57_009961 [Friedmanniomyces endolithicus]